MGLLAIVAGQARRLGLVPQLIRALPLLSLACVVSGIIWLCVLPLKGQYRDTYLSENALLPHQAITFFRETEWNIVRGYKGQIKELDELQVPETDRNALVAELLEQSGLTAATHDWSVGDASGQNVYAISHASRGPYNEALVIVAPWIGPNGGLNEGGTALLLALARFFQKWNFWHKNLIFVMPSTGDVALREWVDAYHTSLQYTAGRIEGAIVLNYEFDAEFFDHVEVGFEGMNGQLPNLDLINTAVYSVAAEFAESSVLGNAPDSYAGRLTTLSRHIWQQATAGISQGSGSGMFSGWRIDAISLTAVPGNSQYDITTLGRVCESTARSVNNLLEHFHQSFFFYLMLGPDSFVSIASYLPAAMLVANSFPVMALYNLATLPAAIPALDIGSAALALGFVTVASSLLGYLVVNPLLVALGVVAIGVVLLVFVSTRPIGVRQALSMGCLISLGLELTTLAMINFSLALALGILCAPLAWVRPTNSLGRSSINGFLLGLACPAVVLVTLAHYAYDMPVLSFLNRLAASYHELSSWTWILILGIWVPAWLVSAACI